MRRKLLACMTGLAISLGVCCAAGVTADAAERSVSVKTAGTDNMRIYGICLTQDNGSTADAAEEDANGGDSYGDAVLVESNGAYLLMDTGSEGTAKSLVKYLKDVGVKNLDVYISHTHNDHRGGLDAVCENFKVNKIYLPDQSIGTEYVESASGKDTDQETIYRILARTAEAEGAAIEYLKTGSTFSFGAVSVEILGPLGEYRMDQFADAAGTSGSQSGHYLNNCSLTAVLTCGKTKFLTSGDIEVNEESELLKKYGAQSGGKLDADIMKFCHHGLKTSNSDAFISAVSPTWSFGENMGYTDEIERDGKFVPKTYTAQNTVQQYGFTYMVGTEQRAIIIEVKDDAVVLCRDQNNDGKAAADEKLKGWTEVCGIMQGKDTHYTDKSKFYLGADSKPLTGIQKIDGAYYYLGAGGAMERGTYEKKNVYKGWRDFDGKSRYFELSGKMYVGFNKIKGTNGETNTFYFDGEGFRVVGNKDWEPIEIEGKMYALNENGAVFNNGGKGGWKTYKVKDNAAKVNYRYFDKKGVMLTGWQTFSGKKYYLDSATGFRTLGLKEIGGKTYYFVEVNAAGYMYNAGWKAFKEGKDTCYRFFDKKGVMKKGFFTDKGNTYYLDPVTGYRATGFKKIDGKMYFFRDWGAMVKGTTMKVGSATFKFDKKGVMTSPKLKQVTGAKAKASGKKVNQISWKKISGVNGYVVYRSDSKKGLYTEVGLVKKGATVKYKDKTAQSGKTYYYKVAAYKTIGGYRIEGADSSPQKVKTK